MTKKQTNSFIIRVDKCRPSIRCVRLAHGAGRIFDHCRSPSARRRLTFLGAFRRIPLQKTFAAVRPPRNPPFAGCCATRRATKSSSSSRKKRRPTIRRCSNTSGARSIRPFRCHGSWKWRNLNARITRHRAPPRRLSRKKQSKETDA